MGLMVLLYVDWVVVSYMCCVLCIAVWNLIMAASCTCGGLWGLGVCQFGTMIWHPLLSQCLPKSLLFFMPAWPCKKMNVIFLVLEFISNSSHLWQITPAWTLWCLLIESLSMHAWVFYDVSHSFSHSSYFSYQTVHSHCKCAIQFLYYFTPHSCQDGKHTHYTYF